MSTVYVRRETGLKEVVDASDRFGKAVNYPLPGL